LRRIKNQNDMKKALDSNTENGYDSLFSAAITLALITLCFICTSVCTAQDTLRPLHDSLYTVRMEPTEVDSSSFIEDTLLPMVSATMDQAFWDTETIHIKGIDLKSLPDTIKVVLVDSLHGCCIPFSKGYVYSKFKYRGRHAHKGVDIPLHIGDDIYAAFDGVVRVVMPKGKSGGYGNLIVIRHFNGLETYYGHLLKYLVQSGDTVSAGDLIGLSGNTGRSTGPHLHFETRYLGKAFDPERIFDFNSGTLRTKQIELKKHYFSCHSHFGMTDQQSLAVFTNPPRLAPTPKYYKVRRGDSLTRIAKRKGTTVKNICRLNGIKANKCIYVGQRLRIK
jgi:hypothetical protein